MRAMPEHNALMEDVAQRMGIPFFDLHRTFNPDPEYLPDGLHVSPKGSDLKARLYYDYLVEEYKLFREKH